MWLWLQLEVNPPLWQGGCPPIRISIKLQKNKLLKSSSFLTLPGTFYPDPDKSCEKPTGADREAGRKGAGQIIKKKGHKAPLFCSE